MFFKKYFLFCSAIIIFANIFFSKNLVGQSLGSQKNNLSNVYSINQIFDDALRFSKSGNIKKSIELFDRLIESGYHSSSIYFNLGLIYFEKSELAKSVLYFNKALWFTPNDTKTLFYLKKCLNELNLNFKERVWWEVPIYLFSSLTWSKLCIISLILIFILVYFKLFYFRILYTDKRNFLGVINLSIATLFLVSLISLSCIFYYFSHFNNSAIILNNNVELKLSPSPDSDFETILKEGEKVKIIGNFNEFYKIKASEINVGWVKKSLLEKVVM